MQADILYEDKDILVLKKPAGVPVQSKKVTDYDLVSQIQNYYYNKTKEQEPYVGLIHRLDLPVGGILVFARNQKSAKELSRQVQEHEFVKRYLAITSTKLAEDKHEKTLTDYLIKDARANISKVAGNGQKMAKYAELKYRIIKPVFSGTLLQIELKTGRHHQIRVQLSHHGMPIWGDTKYNPLFIEKETREAMLQEKEKMGSVSLRLYAYHLEFFHPVSKRKMEFEQFPDWKEIDSLII